MGLHVRKPVLGGLGTTKYVTLGYIKKISVSRVTGLKILGRVGTQIFIIFFLEKNIILCILKGIFAFQNA